MSSIVGPRGIYGINLGLLQAWKAAKKNSAPQVTDGEIQKLWGDLDGPLYSGVSTETFMELPRSSRIAYLAYLDKLGEGDPQYEPADVMEGTFRMNQTLCAALLQPTFTKVGDIHQDACVVSVLAMTTVSVLGCVGINGLPEDIPSTVIKSAMSNVPFWLRVEKNAPSPQSDEAQIFDDAVRAHAALRLFSRYAYPMKEILDNSMAMRIPKLHYGGLIAREGDVFIVGGANFLKAVGPRVD